MSLRFKSKRSGVHSNEVTIGKYAAFKDIAYTELAADLPHVCGLALVRERSISRDDEAARECPQEIGGQAVSDAVREIVLSLVGAEVQERKDDDR